MRKIFTLALFSMFMMGGVTMKAQYTDVTLKVGDTYTDGDNKEWLVGANEAMNGNFDTCDSEGNIPGWTNAAYQQMTTANFNWYKEGGHDGGAYITGKENKGSSNPSSIGQRWTLEPNTKYYLSFWVKGYKTGGELRYVVISKTNVESTAGGQNEYDNENLDNPTAKPSWVRMVRTTATMLLVTSM